MNTETLLKNLGNVGVADLDHISLHVKTSYFKSMIDLFVQLIGHQNSEIKQDENERWTFISFNNGQRLQLIEWKGLEFKTDKDGARHLCLSVSNPPATLEAIVAYCQKLNIKTRSEDWGDKIFVHMDCLCTGIELCKRAW